MNRMLLAAAACLAAASPAARATDPPEAYESSLSYGDADHVMKASVSFYASCGPECYAATLTCDRSANVDFVYGDVEFDIAAKAVTQGGNQFVIKVGALAQTFSIMDLRYAGDMNSTWNVEGDLRGDSADFIAALGKAKEFTAVIGAEKLTLPATEDVANWVLACAK